VTIYTILFVFQGHFRLNVLEVFLVGYMLISVQF